VKQEMNTELKGTGELSKHAGGLCFVGTRSPRWVSAKGRKWSNLYLRQQCGSCFKSTGSFAVLAIFSVAFEKLLSLN
jgi:hypothetical protein